jgi:hypothetical protein
MINSIDTVIITISFAKTSPTMVSDTFVRTNSPRSRTCGSRRTNYVPLSAFVRLRGEFCFKHKPVLRLLTQDTAPSGD